MGTPFDSRRATLVDVAKAAGVAPMTVSRTLSGHPYVAEETAKRVRAAIRSLGYRPNLAARMLVGQRSTSIGLIVPDIADPFFATVSRSVQLAARKAGHTVWLAMSDGDVLTEKAELEQMLYHPVDGIILAPVSSRAKHLNAAAAGTIPIVTIDRPIESATTDSIEVENQAGARLGVEHLLLHGFRRIACIATDYHLRSIRLRVAAYETLLESRKLRPRKVIIREKEEVFAAVQNLLKSRYRPDALFATNNFCTMQVIQALHTLGMRMPKDIALIGFDDLDFYPLMEPPITALRQPLAEIGRTAGQLLLDRVRGDGPSLHAQITLPVDLIVRESCGCTHQHQLQPNVPHPVMVSD